MAKSSRTCSAWLCRAYLNDPKTKYCQKCGKLQKHPHDDPPLFGFNITTLCASCGHEQYGWHESVRYCPRCGVALIRKDAKRHFNKGAGTKSSRQGKGVPNDVDRLVLEFLGGKAAWSQRQRIVTPSAAPHLLDMLGIDATGDEPCDPSAIVDVFLLLGDYETAWSYIKRHEGDLRLRVYLLPLMVLNVLSHCPNRRLDGMDVLALTSLKAGWGTSRFRWENQEAVAAAATPMLDRLYDKHGENLLQHCADKDKYGEVLRLPFDGYYWTGSPMVWRSPSDSALEEANERMREVMRDAENSARVRMGVPKIGEGWVQETMLIYRVKDAFPQLEAVQHGRPDWLSPQHLDVWIPSLNIGIEFQGEQHFRPIAYFGGEEAHKASKERDARKESLCRANGCHLIVVRQGYDWNDVRQAIERRAAT